MKRKILIVLALAVGVLAKATVVTTVGSVAELQALATSVNAGDSYAGITVTLTADLNLSEVSWTPIGTTTHPFMGTFDGLGHRIANLTVNVAGSTTGNVAGLFGQIGVGGTVRDVHVTSGSVQFSSVTSSCCSGSIAGYNSGTIVGCSNAAEVRGNFNNASVGGIAGENTSMGVIRNCYNTGSVTTGDYSGNRLGGIAGQNSHNIGNCFVVASVSDVGSYGPICGKHYAGSITGCFYLNGKPGDFADLLVVNNAADNSITGKANVLLADRTLNTTGNWNTLCLPFGIPAGAAGYSPIAGAWVKELSSSSFADGTLTLNFTDATSIEAGKPYLVKWKNTIMGNLPNPVFMNVTVGDGSTGDVKTDKVDFVGTFSPVTLTDGNNSVLYLGAGNKLYYPMGGDVSVNACRAYFKLNGVTAGDPSAGAGSFVLNFDSEEATGIETVHGSRVHGSDVWYTLDGRRLGGKPTAKGIYINNGKKVKL